MAKRECYIIPEIVPIEDSGYVHLFVYAMCPDDTKVLIGCELIVKNDAKEIAKAIEKTIEKAKSEFGILVVK